MRRYGDISAATKKERAVASVVMILGCGFFAWYRVYETPAYAHPLANSNQFVNTAAIARCKPSFGLGLCLLHAMKLQADATPNTASYKSVDVYGSMIVLHPRITDEHGTCMLIICQHGPKPLPLSPLPQLPRNMLFDLLLAAGL